MGKQQGKIKNQQRSEIAANKNQEYFIHEWGVGGGGGSKLLVGDGKVFFFTRNNNITNETTTNNYTNHCKLVAAWQW